MGDADGLEVASRVVGWVALALLALLAVTGVYLYFFYRPADVQSWNDIKALQRSVTTGILVRRLHRGAAALLVPVVLASFGLSIAARTRRSIAAGVANVALALAAGYTGYLLPWDQLALWAVTVGTNMTGYQPLQNGQVRFVLAGGAELAPSTVLRALYAHVAFGLVAVGPILLRRSRRPDAGVPRPSAPSHDEVLGLRVVAEQG